MRTASILIAAFLVALALRALSQEPVTIAPTRLVEQFERGTQFTYRTRPGEESSRLVVVARLTHPKLGIVFVVRVDNGDTSTCVTLTSNALEASVVSPIGKIDFVSDEECVEGVWREEWEKDNVYVFEESVASALDFFDEVARRTRRR